MAQARLGARVATAPLVAGERVFVLGVDRSVHAFDAHRRPQALVGAAPGRPADAGAARRGPAVQQHPDRRPGAAAGRRRPAGRHRALGSADRPRRAAPTRSSAWPTWSARRCAAATRSARVRSRPAVGCVDAEPRRCVWTHRHAAAPTRSAATRPTSSAPTRSDRISAWRTRQRRRRVWTSEALLYRGLSGAGRARRDRSSSATPQGWCTACRARPASAQLRLPTDGSADRRHRRRSPARRCWCRRGTAACSRSVRAERRRPVSASPSR